MQTSRRGILKGLLAAPFAALLGMKAKPKRRPIVESTTIHPAAGDFTLCCTTSCIWYEGRFIDLDSPPAPEGWRFRDAD